MIDHLSVEFQLPVAVVIPQLDAGKVRLVPARKLHQIFDVTRLVATLGSCVENREIFVAALHSAHETQQVAAPTPDSANFDDRLLMKNRAFFRKIQRNIENLTSLGS